MIDLKTGRFTLREGVELYPGMTREDFFKSPLYETELLDEEEREDEKTRLYHLKPQDIDGDIMQMAIRISYNDYVEDVQMTRPDFYEWPKWKLETGQKALDYAYEIKKYNDKFLQRQIQGNIRESNDLWFDYDWGSITSSFSFRYVPSVFVTISYDEIPFLEAKGVKFSGRFLL